MIGKKPSINGVQKWTVFNKHYVQTSIKGCSEHYLDNTKIPLLISDTNITKVIHSGGRMLNENTT